MIIKSNVKLQHRLTIEHFDNMFHIHVFISYLMNYLLPMVCSKKIQSNRHDRIVLSDPASPLPVELVTFVAELENDINVIEWSTASEWNSDYFNVEWSDDTENWRTISTTPAAGYSNQLIHYVYYDCFPQPIINYYRLVQFDFDGESETFGPIVVDNRKQEKRILRYVSLSGQEIDPTSTTGLVIGIFEDGTTVKVYL